MLQVSRSPGRELPKPRVEVHSDAPRNGSQAYPAHSEFLFIPELLFALLMSVYQSPGELSRVLQQDWINDWDGWEEARKLCDVQDDDAKHKIAEEFVVRFARIRMNNVRRN